MQALSSSWLLNKMVYYYRLRPDITYSSIFVVFQGICIRLDDPALCSRGPVCIYVEAHCMKMNKTSWTLSSFRVKTEESILWRIQTILLGNPDHHHIFNH